MNTLGVKATRPGARITYAVVILVFLGGVAVTAHFQARRDAIVAASRIVVSPDSLDFGAVWAQKEFEWTLRLHNPTDEEVRIADIGTSCGCTSVSPSSLALSPGETEEVRLTIDLTPLPPGETAVWERPYEIQIVPAIDSHIAPEARWHLKGTVRRPLRVSPPVVDFEDRLIHGEAFDPAALMVEAFEPLEDVSVDCDRDLCRIELDSETNDRGTVEGVTEMRVWFSEHLPVGTFESVAFIRGKSRQNGPFPPVPVRITGKVLSRVGADPDHLRLGIRRLGETVVRELELFSRVDKPFAVRHVVSDSPSVTISPPSADYAVRHRFVVTSHCAELGEQTAELKFEVREDSGEDLLAWVPVAVYVAANHPKVAKRG